MNIHRRLIALGCLMGLTGPAVSAVFEVPDGEYFSLREAVRQAEGNGEADTILLAPGGTYRPGGSLTLDAVTTSIRIYGRGATIDGNNASGGRLFTVSETGTLLVANLNVVNVNHQVNEPFYSGGVLDNQGNAVLRNVTIAGTTITANSGNVLGGAVANMGSLTLVNVTLSGNRVAGSGNGSAVYNAGDALIANTTITGNVIEGNTSGRAALDTTSADTTTLQNTVIADNTATDCNGTLASSGGNLDSDGSCGFNAGSDKPGADPRLMALADHGGGILTHALQDNSPALNAGHEALCHPMDARGVPRPQSGNTAAGNRCDMGAHENWNGGFGFKDAATASWFDPAQSGHGFMFEKLPDGRLLVTWFVFDPAGNRDWIQALGRIEDNIARLTAYQVLDGLFPPAFDPEATTLRYWGTLSVVFTRCNAGAAAWHPDVPGYSPGGMPLSRLTSVAGVTCN